MNKILALLAGLALCSCVVVDDHPYYYNRAPRYYVEPEVIVPHIYVHPNVYLYGRPYRCNK